MPWRQDFALVQNDFLKGLEINVPLIGKVRVTIGQTQDVKILAGVCAAMTYDWMKRRLSGLEAARKTYQDIGFLVPQQRAITDGNYCFGNQGHYIKMRQMIGKGDKLTVEAVDVALNMAAYADAAAKIDALAPGCYELFLVKGAVGHSTAIHVKAGGSKFFDPNAGQYGSADAMGAEIAELWTRIYAGSYLGAGGNCIVFKFAGTPRDKAWLQKNPA